MGLKTGVTPLEKLKTFKARNWYDKAFIKCAAQIADDYMTRNEIIRGGEIATGASRTNSTFNINLGDGSSATDIYSVLNGRIMAAIGYQTDRDLLATGESFMGTAIYSDGSAASGATIATNESAYATLIVCNSDGSGDVVVGGDGAATAGGDNGQAQLLCVFAGTGTTDYDEDHLTSAEIQAALDASTGVHDGTTGWVHYAQIVWTDTSGTVTVTPTMNRNNIVSEA
jgi:hypothetical protein